MILNMEQENSDIMQALFKEAALILGDDAAPPNNHSSLLEPGKTPILYVHEAGLATTCDGGRAVLCNN